MADDKKFDVEQIQGSQFMDDQDRQYFEKFGSAMDGQAEALAEQYKIDPKEANDKFDFLMDTLIYNLKEYIVNGAPLKCSMQADENSKQELFYHGKIITSKPLPSYDKSALQLPEEREEDTNGLVFANVSDTTGGLSGELLTKGGKLNIASFGNCKYLGENSLIQVEEIAEKIYHALVNSRGYKGTTKEEVVNGILEALESNKGTCYCCMLLNSEWENLPVEYDYMDNSFQKELPSAGVSRALFSESYMQFGGREGINMMSMLFCRYGGGIISAKESGQSLVDMTVQDMLWRDLKNMGYSDIAIAAIMGNISWESQFIVGNTQNGKPAGEDGVGIGLCQWTFKTRKQGLIQFANEMGLTWDTYEVQIDYIEHEISEGGDFEIVGPEKMNEYNDVDEATEFFMWEYENPNKEDAHLEDRQEAARGVLKDYCGK